MIPSMLGPPKFHPDDKDRPGLKELMDSIQQEEDRSNLVKNQFLREDLMKIAQDWQIPKIMKVLKDHGLISGD